MDPTLHFTIEVITAIGTVFASSFMFIAYRRFIKGEFSNIIKWVAYSYAFFAIYKVLEVISGYIIVYADLIMYISYIFVLVAIASVVRSALLLNKFSKVYGFKDVEKRFAEEFIKGIKDIK